MTKQQAIMNGVDKILKKRIGDDEGVISYEILSYLKSRGVVIKGDKKISHTLVNELNDAMGVIELDDCKLLIKQAFHKAGYEAVEPLV